MSNSDQMTQRGDDQCRGGACRPRARAGTRRSDRALRLLRDRRGRPGPPRSSRASSLARNRNAPCPAAEPRGRAPVLADERQPQAVTDPAGTSLQRASLVIQPASTTTSGGCPSVIGSGFSRVEVTTLFLGVVNGRGARDLGDVLVLAQRRWQPRRRPCRARGRPSRRSTVCVAEGDVVEGGLVAVLAGHRHLAGEALGRRAPR